MRSLDEIRERAWAVRAECLGGGRSLLDGLRDLIGRHGVALAPVHANAIEGGDAELQPPALLYDEALNDDPTRLAYVLAHELGHLEFHPRVRRKNYRANPIAAAIYLRQQDVGAVATYSHRLPEETEAIAFANEVACPSRDVFERWRQGPERTALALAAHFSAPVELVTVQLVEGLYRMALGTAPSAYREGRETSAPNPRQSDAIQHLDGPALIQAGPGTGKTWTLVEHAVRILRDPQVVGDNLLVLTFSNEAAEELRARIGPALSGLPDERVGVFTFHGFGYYLVRLFHKDLGYSTPPRVLDEAGQSELILDAFARSESEAIFKLKDPEGAASEAAAHINHLKQRLRTPKWLRDQTASLAAEGDDRYEAKRLALTDLWEAYEGLKREKGRVDFADLIAIPIDYLRANDKALGLVRSQFQRVLIDEYQDVSLATGALVRTLCLDDDGSVAVAPWVVGDQHQGIYAFLGGDVRNVTGFASEFDAREIGLVQSYRSARPITEAANTLAALMDGRYAPDPEHALVPAPHVEPYSDDPVRVVSALTDAGEYEGVADLVAEWLNDSTVKAEDVAVLARRNADVREIAKAIAHRGHPTTTSGIVTAEGAAGDIVAAMTLADDPESAVARLAMALGPIGLTLQARNETIAQALNHLGQGHSLSTLTVEGTGDQAALASEIRAANQHAAEQIHTADAFLAATSFLFESSLYLRRTIDACDADDETIAATASLTLAELATTLGHAAAYRFSHDRTPPREARLRFAAHFRRTLARSTPSAIAPRRSPGFVRVMTCHASKGLEFPLVVVAGQRLPGGFRRRSWLPPEPEVDGPDQADALLYVGVTRAERAVVVSFAERATSSGGEIRRPKLLDAWIETGSVTLGTFPEVESVDRSVEIGPLWGTRPDRRVRVRGIAKDSCSIRGYVQDELRLSFPRPEPSLYGTFVARMRQVVGALFQASHSESSAISEEAALRVLAESWPTPVVEEHRLAPFFDDVARRVAVGWSSALDRSSLTLPAVPLLLDLGAVSHEVGVDLSSGLAAFGRDASGRPVGIVLHLGSLQQLLKKGKHEVGWGAKSTDLQRSRPELALLRSYYDSIDDEPFEAYIYSAEDGEIYPFGWPNGRYYAPEVERIGARLSEVADRRYVHEVDLGQCERCGVRVACPYWSGASGDRPRVEKKNAAVASG